MTKSLTFGMDRRHLPRKRPESSLKMVTLMTKTLWILLFSIGLLAAANSADAGVLGRHLGLGWGDGYHARCGCGHHGCCSWLHHLKGCRYHDGHCGKGKCKGKCNGAAPGYAVYPGYPAEPAMPSTYVPTPAVYPELPSP